MLLKELRGMGLGCWAAAQALGITVLMSKTLPTGAAYAADVGTGLLICLSSEPEWSMWAGVAHFLAYDLGLRLDNALIFDAASAMSGKSGILFRNKIA